MKAIKITSLLTVTAVAVYVALLGSRATGEPSDTFADAGKPAPAWTLTDISGKVIHSTDLKGKVVVLDFWATWCGPCRIEIPGFIALQKEYGDQGLTVIGASVDEGGPTVVKKFAGQIGINYPVGVADDSIQAAFGGIVGLPTTFIIDRQGRFVRKHLGLTDQSVFEAELKPLLAQKP
jgi:thiol-disulfide isomerase/thioredoxin